MDRSIRLVDKLDPDALRTAGRLLHEFNTEFDAPTPGAHRIAERLATVIGPGLFVVLAGEPPRAVAVVSLRPNIWFDGPVATLDELYVAPQHRGSGIGSRLLEFVRNETRRRGVEHIEINVDEQDGDARRFYERHGFSVIDPDTNDRALYYTGPAVWSNGKVV